MFSRVSEHLKEELGTSDVTMIIGDTYHKDLVLYSNRNLDGYTNIRGTYTKSVPIKDLTNTHKLTLKSKDSRFYSKTSTYTNGTDGYTIVDNQKPNELEAEILSVDGPHAFCRSDVLSEIMGERGYGFSNESTIVHEGGHGAINNVILYAEDIFGDNFSLVDETVATLIELKYLEKYLQNEAKKMKDFISSYKTDNIHEESFKTILNERHRAEEMRKVLKMLNENCAKI